MRHNLVRRFNEPDHVMMPGTRPPLYANAGIELMTLEKMTGIEKLKKKQIRFSRFKQFQINVFNVLERPGTSIALVYHGFVFVLILASLLLSVLVTIPKYKNDNAIQVGVYYLEISLVIVFSLEYLLRIWSCSCHGNYTGFWGRARFIKKPYMVIDIIVIVATTVVVGTSQEGRSDYLSVSMFRFLRFLQVLRILRLDRQRGAFKIVSHVVYEHRQELLTCWYMSFILLVACSFLVYLAEKGDDNINGEQNDSEVQNLGDGLYWGIITLSTVGYGDFSPQNWVAKLITCIFAFIGTAFFALPAGILGSGFALQVAQNQKQKHFNRRRNPAAFVIQYAWRFYSAHPSRGSDATWAPHQVVINPPKDKKFSMYAGKHHQSPAGTPTTTRRSMAFIRKKLIASRMNSTYMEGDTFTSRRSSIGATIPSALELRDRCQSEGNLLLVSPNNVEDHQATIVSLPHSHMGIDGANDTLHGRPSSFPYHSTQDLQLQPLLEKEKDCIRFIRKIKLFIYIRKFKEECRPYDVKDVIEQYTEGQMEMFSFIKRFQFRMEGVLGIKDGEDEIALERSLHFRVGNVEKKVDILDNKLDAILQLLRDRGSHHHHHSHHHRKSEHGSSNTRSINSLNSIFCSTNDVNLNVPCDQDEPSSEVSRERRAGTVGADELTRRLEKLRYENSKGSLQDFRTRAESRFTVTPSVLTLNQDEVRSRNTDEKPRAQNNKVDNVTAPKEEKRQNSSSELKSLIGSNDSKIKKYQSAPLLMRNDNSLNEDLDVFLAEPTRIPGRRSNSVHFDESSISTNQKQQHSDACPLPQIPPLEACNQCYLSGGSSSGSSSVAGSAKSSPNLSREKISNVANILSHSTESANVNTNSSKAGDKPDTNNKGGPPSKGMKATSSEPTLKVPTVTTSSRDRHKLPNDGKVSKSSFELNC